MNNMQSEEQTPHSADASDIDNNPRIKSNALPLSPARRAVVENVSILFKHKYLILSVTVIVTAIVAWYSFTKMPNYYKAQTIILPARHTGGELDNVTAGISSTLKDIGLAKLKGGEESYSPLSLMRSRELQEKLVRQFNFQKVYQSETMDGAVKEFSDHLDGDLNEEGNFIVSFDDTSATRAAQVANAVVDEINNVNSRLAKEEAEHNVSFVKARYEQNAADLDSAEHAFIAFQRKYGLFSLTDQARAEMTAIAGIEEEKMQTEVQMHSAEQMHGANSADVAVYKGTIDELEAKLAQMKVGMDANASSFVPTNVLPDVAIKYLSLTREFEIQSKLKAFLLPSYEQAKLDENKDLYGFVTLDHAVPPVKKAGPHRSIILVQALLSSSIITSFLVLVLTGIRRIRMNFARDRQQLGV